MEECINNILEKPTKAISARPRFTLDTDLTKISKNSIVKNSQEVKIKIPAIFKEKSISCSFLTDRGLFPSNRKRVSWNKEVIFENIDYKITASCLSSIKNEKTGKREEQSTNQNDLDILYAILSHFGDREQCEKVEIPFSSIKKILCDNDKKARYCYDRIVEAIDRIDGLQLRVLSKRDNIDASIGFFERPTPSYVYAGNGSSKSVIIQLDKNIFSQLIKERVLFIPMSKRNEIKSLVGKWLFSYVYSRRPNVYDITIDEAINRSGFLGKKSYFVNEIKNALLILNKSEACNGYVSSGYNSKIIFNR